MMVKTRILHLPTRMRGGGIETFIREIAAVTGDGLRHRVFSCCKAVAYQESDIPFCEVEADDVAPLAGVIRLASVLRSWRPHVLHAHGSDTVRYAVLAREIVRPKPKLVVHWHGVYSGGPSRTRMGGWLGKCGTQQASAILACSEAVAHLNQRHDPLAVGRVRVLYNPVSTADYGTTRAGDLSRACEDGLRAIFLGRLSVQVKGLDVLCEAVRLLPDELPLRLALIGPGDHQALREELQPPPRVTLEAAVDRAEVPAVFGACDIYLHPSRSEGLGISIIEAMAAGLPVIASRVGGIPEAVVDGETGILVPSEDPQALADAIQWMVEHPEDRAEMGRRGRERAMLFDVHTIAAQLEQIYREVLDG